MKWKTKPRDESDEREDTERGEMDNDDINRNINGFDDKYVIKIVVDQCLQGVNWALTTKYGKYGIFKNKNMTKIWDFG